MPSPHFALHWQGQNRQKQILRILEANVYRLFWVFRNHHQWEQVFPDYETMVSFINTCGLVSHPDIVTIAYKDRAGLHHTLKENGEVFCFVN